MRLSSVDLPALGRPTSPTSASSFSSRRSQCASDWPPTVRSRGVWLVAVAKVALPRPPPPPAATCNVAPSWSRSPSTAASSRSRTMVPTGTSITKSDPEAPVRQLPSPGLPAGARYSTRSSMSKKVVSCGEARSITEPPRPPLPPAGPPRGANFSCRKATMPSPPLPDTTWMARSSWNMGNRGYQAEGVHRAQPVVEREGGHPLVPAASSPLRPHPRGGSG